MPKHLSKLNNSPPMDATRNDTVHQTVLRLNALCKTTTMQFTLAIGKLVLDNLYAGDISRLCSRSRKEHAALRSVAADPALAMSASALYRSIAVFDVCERIGVRAWRHVSTSHVRLVLALPVADQEQLLREAEVNRWPVRILEQQVAAIAESHPLPARRGGRKRRTRLRSMIANLHKQHDRLVELLGLDDEALAESSPESVRAAAEELRRVGEACAGMAERVARCRRQSGIHVPELE
jgi:hypothetical protein